MDLSELLDRSTPALARRDEALTRELHDLVARSESVIRPRTAAMRFGMSGALAAGVLGLGSVASAAGILDGWLPWTTSAGTSCELEISAALGRPGDGEQRGPTFSTSEREATLASAQSFLSGVDYAAIDRQAAIREWKAAEAKARSGQADPAERQPALEGDELELAGVMHHVTSDLRAHLQARGLDVRAVSITWANRCGQ